MVRWLNLSPIKPYQMSSFPTSGFRAFFRRIMCRLGLISAIPASTVSAPPYLSRKIGRALYYIEKLRGLDSLGDCLAFGYDNSSVMNLALEEISKTGENIRFFGFDSSTYLSSRARKKAEITSGASSIEGTIIRGRFSATLNAEEKSNYHLHKVSLVLIDAQLHTSAKKALEFVFPMIPAHAMIIFYNCNGDRFWGNSSDALNIMRDLLTQNRSLQAKELETYYGNGNTDCRSFLVSNVYYQQKLALVSKHLIKHGDINLGEFSVFPVSDN